MIQQRAMSSRDAGRVRYEMVSLPGLSPGVGTKTGSEGGH